MPTVTVRGLPSPKGSLRCIGSRGRVKHQLIEDDRPGQKEWRARVAEAGRALLGELDQPYSGPVALTVTFTLPRPKSVSPARRWWPYRKPTADLDKLVRLVADGLADAGLYRDDVQICQLRAEKTYPYDPDVPTLDSGLTHTGARIMVRPLDEAQP